MANAHLASQLPNVILGEPFINISGEPSFCKHDAMMPKGCLEAIRAALAPLNNLPGILDSSSIS